MPIEIWTSKSSNYSHLHIFESPVYVIYNAIKTSKLDPKSRKCIFLRYANGIKEYCLWDPIAYKVIINKDVIFIKDKI